MPLLLPKPLCKPVPRWVWTLPLYLSTGRACMCACPSVPPMNHAAVAQFTFNTPFHNRVVQHLRPWLRPSRKLLPQAAVAPSAR